MGSIQIEDGRWGGESADGAVLIRKDFQLAAKGKCLDCFINTIPDKNSADSHAVLFADRPGMMDSQMIDMIGRRDNLELHLEGIKMPLSRHFRQNDVESRMAWMVGKFRREKDVTQVGFV